MILALGLEVGASGLIYTGGGPLPKPPVNTVAPTIDDTTPVSGAELTGSAGTWTGVPTPAYAYQWKRITAGVPSNVGTNSVNYTSVQADEGNLLRLTVTATNTQGVASASSADTSAVAAGLSNDTSLSTFTVDGNNATDGGTVNLANGTTSVTVVATPTNGGATVGTITGDTGLSTGNNLLEFDVTAEDGVTTNHYNATLHVLTAGAAEIFTIDFTGLTGADFITLGEGKYFVFRDLTAPGVVFAAWFKVDGVEVQPDASGQGVTNYLPVNISLLDDAEAIADALRTQALDGIDTGSILEHVSSTAGVVADAADFNTGAVITVTQQGSDPA